MMASPHMVGVAVLCPAFLPCYTLMCCLIFIVIFACAIQWVMWLVHCLVLPSHGMLHGLHLCAGGRAAAVLTIFLESWIRTGQIDVMDSALRAEFAAGWTHFSAAWTMYTRFCFSELLHLGAYEDIDVVAILRSNNVDPSLVDWCARELEGLSSADAQPMPALVASLREQLQRGVHAVDNVVTAGFHGGPDGGAAGNAVPTAVSPQVASPLPRLAWPLRMPLSLGKGHGPAAMQRAAVAMAMLVKWGVRGDRVGLDASCTPVMRSPFGEVKSFTAYQLAQTGRLATCVGHLITMQRRFGVSRTFAPRGVGARVRADGMAHLDREALADAWARVKWASHEAADLLVDYTVKLSAHEPNQRAGAAASIRQVWHCVIVNQALVNLVLALGC